MSSLIGLTARAALCCVFGAAVASKVSNRRRWAAFVGALPALGIPSGLSGRMAAAGVIGGEAAALATLVAVPRLGAAISAGLLLVFTVALAAAVRANRRTGCHCFGSSDAPIGRGHVVRNLGLMVVAAAVFRAEPSRPLELAWRHVASVGYGVLIGFVVTRWDDVEFLVGVKRDPPAPAARSSEAG